jgi:hypothetical protein
MNTGEILIDWRAWPLTTQLNAGQQAFRQTGKGPIAVTICPRLCCLLRPPLGPVSKQLVPSAPALSPTRRRAEASAWYNTSCMVSSVRCGKQDPPSLMENFISFRLVVLTVALNSVSCGTHKTHRRTSRIASTGTARSHRPWLESPSSLPAVSFRGINFVLLRGVCRKLRCVDQLG